MITSRVAYISAWVIVAAIFVGSVIAYPFLPPVVATHWNADNVVNGTMGPFAGAFLLPCMMLVLLLIFIAIPSIDPLRENIESFRRQYNTFVACILLLLAIVQASLLSWNVGFEFDVRLVILPAIGLLLIYLGTILPQTKRNWFIGIRTPWTVSSDFVWKKTHELGGRLFQILGGIVILSIFVEQYAFAILVAPLIIIVVGLMVYSYVLYEKHEKHHSHHH
jgi:uncharacterized membrane protein